MSSSSVGVQEHQLILELLPADLSYQFFVARETEQLEEMTVLGVK